jgi:molybdenum cofactor biosynthesis enzyme MoaA
MRPVVRAGPVRAQVRLTGGEPTLRRDIVGLTQALAGLPGIQHLAMTTNGITLARQLPALREAGERPAPSAAPAAPLTQVLSGPVWASL